MEPLEPVACLEPQDHKVLLDLPELEPQEQLVQLVHKVTLAAQDPQDQPDLLVPQDQVPPEPLGPKAPQDHRDHKVSLDHKDQPDRKVPRVQVQQVPPEHKDQVDHKDQPERRLLLLVVFRMSMSPRPTTRKQHSMQHFRAQWPVMVLLTTPLAISGCMMVHFGSM